MLRNSPTVMQAKGSESHASIKDHSVEVSTPVAVPCPLHPTSPQMAKSPANSITPINTRIDGHHVEVSALVTVPSPSPQTSPQKAKSLGDVKALSLVLQNHFSSLDGLETKNVRGDPYIGTSTAFVEFTYDHITVEIRLVQNFGLILKRWRKM